MKMKRIFLFPTMLLCFMTKGQEKNINELTIKDTALFHIIDDFVQFNDLNPFREGVIFVLLDDKCSLMGCSGEDAVNHRIEFPLYKNTRMTVRLGLFITSDDSNLINNRENHFQSCFLLKYRNLNIVMCSDALLVCEGCEAEKTSFDLTKSNNMEDIYSVYDYEIGAGIYRVSKVLISGQEF